MDLSRSIRRITQGSLLCVLSACSSGSGGDSGAGANGASRGDAGGEGGQLASAGTDGGGGDDGSASGATSEAGTAAGSDSGPALSKGPPDFGPNVLIFDPSMSSSSIQSRIDTIFQQQQSAQFGTGERRNRHVLPQVHSL